MDDVSPVKSSYTFELTNDQQELLLGLMVNGNFRKREVPYSLYSIEGEKFNATLYAKEKHGTAIEELLEKRGNCDRVVVDQFAPTELTIRRALKTRGKQAKVEQRHEAESDIAVDRMPADAEIGGRSR